MYCSVTCGSLNNSYKADKFSLLTFLRCLNFALYPPMNDLDDGGIVLLAYQTDGPI